MMLNKELNRELLHSFNKLKEWFPDKEESIDTIKQEFFEDSNFLSILSFLELLPDLVSKTDFLNQVVVNKFKELPGVIDNYSPLAMKTIIISVLIADKTSPPKDKLKIKYKNKELLNTINLKLEAN